MILSISLHGIKDSLKYCTLLHSSHKKINKNWAEKYWNVYVQRKKLEPLHPYLPRPLEELRPLGTPTTVPPPTPVPLPMRRSTAVLLTDIEKFLCGQKRNISDWISKGNISNWVIFIILKDNRAASYVKN